jgi:dTDP-4-dehydrorhamnose reductase
MSESITHLVLGASGLLGQELVKHFGGSGAFGAGTLAPRRDELDLFDSVALEKALHDLGPDVVINAAAWTDVDGAENNAEAVFRVNTLAVGQLVDYVLRNEKKLVQISTASVFSGNERQSFSHTSPHSPVNVYNSSKAEAEKICFKAIDQGADVSLFRTYWLYGGGGDFVSLVAAQARKEQKITVVMDQYGQPTLASDLAAQVSASLATGTSRSIFHSVNSGAGVSRLELAFAIFDFFEKDPSLISPVTAESFGALAPRPMASNLDLSSEGDFLMRPWRDALYEYLDGLQPLNSA